jgi:hypothetical protein
MAKNDLKKEAAEKLRDAIAEKLNTHPVGGFRG